MVLWKYRTVLISILQNNPKKAGGVVGLSLKKWEAGERIYEKTKTENWFSNTTDD